jgi:hypothetical protein
MFGLLHKIKWTFGNTQNKVKMISEYSGILLDNNIIGVHVIFIISSISVVG